MKRKNLSGFFALALLLLLWHAGSVLLDKPFLPGPIVVIRTFVRVLSSGGLNRHILTSAYRVLGGTALALAFALPAGLAMGRSGRIDSALFPFVSILYPIPKVVFLPIIIVLLGLGDPPKIFLIALVVCFQLVTVIRDSAKSIPGQYLQAMRSMGARPSQTLRHLIFPCCLPGILTSLKSTLGASMAVLYIAETFASFSGLGYYISNRMDCREYCEMYAGILALSLFGGALYILLERAERLFCGWNMPQPGESSEKPPPGKISAAQGKNVL